MIHSIAFMPATFGAPSLAHGGGQYRCALPGLAPVIERPATYWTKAALSLLAIGPAPRVAAMGPEVREALLAQMWSMRQPEPRP